MIFNIENATKISEEGFTAHLYNTKEQYPAISAVFVECTGGHEQVYVKKSHRLYFVIEGSGTFTINNETSPIKKNDVIVIEPMTPYSYEGQMKLFEVNSPATDSNDQVKI